MNSLGRSAIVACGAQGIGADAVLASIDSGTRVLIGYSGLAGYVAGKWGLRGLTKAAALDLALDRIRVCSVHPGSIATPMTAGLSTDAVADQPIARSRTPEEVAAMVRFVALEDTYSTGSEFVVDGGAAAGITVRDQDR